MLTILSAYMRCPAINPPLYLVTTVGSPGCYMMETVQLSLTKEQAALLKPLLEEFEADRQQLTSSGRPPQSPKNSDQTTNDSSADTGLQACEPPSTNHGHPLENTCDLDESYSSMYIAAELLTKKKKDSKSTRVQNFLHVSK